LRSEVDVTAEWVDASEQAPGDHECLLRAGDPRDLEARELLAGEAPPTAGRRPMQRILRLLACRSDAPVTGVASPAVVRQVDRRIPAGDLAVFSDVLDQVLARLRAVYQAN
jgi:hypothetical protein